MMLIDENILIAYGGVTKIFRKNESLFEEGSMPRCYFQIVSGSVKMYNLSKDSKEFIQGVFYNGESFGEPPLLIDEPYPSSAVAVEESAVIKLPRDSFFEILKQYPDIHLKLTKILANRIYSKAVTLRELVNNSPEDRLLSFLDYCRKKFGNDAKGTLIPFTRQEIANFTGLRVETVIRTLSKMKERKLIEIRNRKLYY